MENSEPHAVQLINIDNRGKCTITSEGRKIVEKITENVAVICVAGLYRTGKSYLINRLLGRQNGFDVGATTNSCTKGLWIWSEPVLLEDKNIRVIIMDTEGLGSAFEDRNESIDMVIFCMSMLLSSFFIYNSMKNIDETAIESLALVTSFAKKIQGKYKDVDSYTNNFPNFLWVIRDFALDLVDANGKEISPSQYLENALTVFEGDSEHSQRKNEIRNLLKLFFRERDCATLPRPVSDEKKLRFIDTLKEREIRPEFLKSMGDLVTKIYFNVRPKVVQGTYLNGKMFIQLCESYVDAVNNDSLPDVKSSWKIVIDNQFASVFEKAIKSYSDSMNGLDLKNITNLEELMKKHYEFKETANEYIKELSNINLPNTFYLDFFKNMDQKLNEQFADYLSKWNNISTKNCQSIGDSLIGEYNDTKGNKNSKIDLLTILEILEDIFKFIENNVSNHKKYEVLYPRITNYFLDNIRFSYKEIKTGYEDQIKALKQEITVHKNILEQTKEMYNKTRESLENDIKTYKEQMLTQRLELESKLEDKNNYINRMESNNKSIIDELRSKISELNLVIETYKQQKIEKSSKKKVPDFDGTIIEDKLDFIMNKMDAYKETLNKNEVEKAKLNIKLDVNNKIEEIQKEFNKKIASVKKSCESMIFKLKSNFTKENRELKDSIKYLYDEIADYKSQVNSQEYKIDLYKEKIISFERDRKNQIDHAELLRTLVQKLNAFIDKKK